MDTKHTPGPWKLTGGRTFETQSGQFHLAYFTDEHGNAKFRNFCELDRNAELIAAAPDMFAALQECITEDSAHCMQHPECQGRRLMAINEIVRAAIAKAKGAPL